jgi:hypothetical protein
METFGKIVAGIILTVLSTIVQGFVIVKLWAWFIVQIFDIRPITLIEAIGLSLFILYVNYRKPSKVEDDLYDIVVHGFIESLTIGGIFLLFGWVVHLIM